MHSSHAIEAAGSSAVRTHYYPRTALLASVSHVYVTGNQHHLQWSTLSITNSFLCKTLRLERLRGSSATKVAHAELNWA